MRGKGGKPRRRRPSLLEIKGREVFMKAMGSVGASTPVSAATVVACSWDSRSDSDVRSFFKKEEYSKFVPSTLGLGSVHFRWLTDDEVEVILDGVLQRCSSSKYITLNALQSAGLEVQGTKWVHTLEYRSDGVDHSFVLVCDDEGEIAWMTEEEFEQYDDESPSTGDEEKVLDNCATKHEEGAGGPF